MKQRHRLEVRLEAGAPELVRWSDWGWAVRLTLVYQHPQTRQRIRIEEVAHVPQPNDFVLHRGGRGKVLCWGFLPNGRLRHPVWWRWASERQAQVGATHRMETRRRAW